MLKNHCIISLHKYNVLPVLFVLIHKIFCGFNVTNGGRVQGCEPFFKALVLK